MEAIVNGAFESGSLSPGWSTCSANFEGAVDNEYPHRPLFITEYNLRMRGNDCVRQEWSQPVWTRGDLTFWAEIETFAESGRIFTESEAGDLFVRMVYEDSTSDTVALNAPGLGEGRPSHYPYYCSVPVRADHRLGSIRLFLRDCPNYWYLTFFSLEKVVSDPFPKTIPRKEDLAGLSHPSFGQAEGMMQTTEALRSLVSESYAHRFSRLEQQVTGLTRFMAEKYRQDLKPGVANTIKAPKK